MARPVAGAADLLLRQGGPVVSPEAGLAGRMSADPTYCIVGFWFFDDWGQYGRTYEKLLGELSRLPEVDKVVLVFPPRKALPGEAVGLEVRRISDKLILVKELERAASPTVEGSATPSENEPSWRRFSWFRRLWSRIALRRFFRQEGIRRQRTIAWYFPPHPYLDELRRMVPARLTVTQIVDDFTQFEPSHCLSSCARAQYVQLPLWSQFILTSSKANFERFVPTGVPCGLFDPGVDAVFLAEPGVLPHTLRGGAPRLGYVGWILSRTDLDLLAHLAARRPEWRFVLAGPEYPSGILASNGLREAANVEVLGTIAHEDVPGFLQTLDVCLIPHRDDALSRSMSPLKLLQYLASGRPVVATAVASLECAGSHIAVARDYAEFERMVVEALEGDTVARSEARIEAARVQTWDLRVRILFDYLREGMRNGELRTCDLRGR
jgi:glycosyltransferase involved in cell wall biosynthesis